MNTYIISASGNSRFQTTLCQNQPQPLLQTFNTGTDNNDLKLTIIADVQKTEFIKNLEYKVGPIIRKRKCTPINHGKSYEWKLHK